MKVLMTVDLNEKNLIVHGYRGSVLRTIRPYFVTSYPFTFKSTFLNEITVILCTLNGMAFGEFTCKSIDVFYWKNLDYTLPDDSAYHVGDGYDITIGQLEETGYTYEELCQHGKKKTVYSWSITNFRLYDKEIDVHSFRLERTGAPVARAPHRYAYIGG